VHQKRWVKIIKNDEEKEEINNILLILLKKGI